MPRGTHVTAADKLELYEGFEAGLKNTELKELTGRSLATISRMRKMWKEEREVPEIESVEVEPEKTETIFVDSDYAKAKEIGDPRYANSSLSIKRAITIESSKSNIWYEMLNKDEIKIGFPDGNVVTMTLKAFERFTDESVDVYIECNKYAKQM